MIATRLAALALSVLAVAGSTGAAPAKSKFDGLWSVLVVTESGTCDRGYRYGVRVQDGVLRYEGEAGFTVSGRVAPNGAVRVTIRRGDQGANGTGRLSGDRGSGRWTAGSSSRQCAGSWSAERR